MDVVLPNELYKKMLEHSLKCYPEEACGLIGGTVADNAKTVVKVYPLENADHSREHFSMKPVEQLKAIQDMRKNGIVPLGNFHSHPDTPSRQSKEDIRLAFDKNASYIIISLTDKDKPVINSFATVNGESIKENLTIKE